MRSIKGIIIGFLLILLGFAVTSYSLIAGGVLAAAGLAAVVIFALPKKTQQPQAEQPPAPAPEPEDPAPELRRGVLGLRRGGGRLFCLRLLRLLRQGEDHDRGQPRRGEHAARDQAVACDGKAEQDQKKADDDAFDGTHGGSSFRCAAAGTSRGSRAALHRACRRRARRYSRGPDKNAGR